MSQSRFNNQAANNTYEQQANIRVEKGQSKELLYNNNKQSSTAMNHIHH